jgi:hypothetical protein
MPRFTSLIPWVLGFAVWGCGHSVPPPSGATGAFGIITVGNVQKMYLPLTDLGDAGTANVAVVNVGINGNGVTGAPAQITMIDLGTSDYATTTSGDSTVVVAASTDFPDIWLIDPVADKVTKTFKLDSTFGTSAFSGGGGYVTGIAMDTANHRAILSVWNGFALLDTTTGTLTQTILAAPAENFGFDDVHQRLIAPFYDCLTSSSSSGPPTTCNSYLAPDGGVITDGVNVIDLKTSTVYTYEDPSAADPTQPLGSEPDAAAADSSTGVALIPSEGTGAQWVLDLSKATFDSAAKTFTAPHQSVAGTGQTGVAIEPTRHYAFLESEHVSDVGFIDINAANSGKGTLIDGQMPNAPDGSFWANLGDPHGVAVTTGISNGNSVGFVVNNSRTWVARIDLDKFKSLGDSLGVVADPSPSVTFLDPRTHP